MREKTRKFLQKYGEDFHYTCRGGDWDCQWFGCTVLRRRSFNHYGPDQDLPHLGFRVVKYKKKRRDVGLKAVRGAGFCFQHQFMESGSRGFGYFESQTPTFSFRVVKGSGAL